MNDDVSLRLPADGAYISVLRTATASLASRLDFTLDDIEDLRIAVDEAVAMMLPHAAPGAMLVCDFSLHDNSLDVAVRIPTVDGALPSRDTFAWTVLTALAGHIDATTEDGNVVRIRLSKQRTNGDRTGEASA